MNQQSQTDQEQYQLALRELPVMLDKPPTPGTPDGDRFEALITLVEKYENHILPTRPEN
ncbi:hypothetical protein ABT364_12600 [Massilia sp. SR12]